MEKKAKELEEQQKVVQAEADLQAADPTMRRGGKRYRNRRRGHLDEDEDNADTFFKRHRNLVLFVVVALIPILTAYYLCT